MADQIQPGEIRVDEHGNVTIGAVAARAESVTTIVAHTSNGDDE